MLDKSGSKELTVCRATFALHELEACTRLQGQLIFPIELLEFKKL